MFWRKGRGTFMAVGHAVGYAAVTAAGTSDGGGSWPGQTPKPAGTASWWLMCTPALTAPIATRFIGTGHAAGLQVPLPRAAQFTWISSMVPVHDARP